MSPEAATAPAHGNATFKARDVEELIDFYLHRRAANLVVRAVAPTNIRPDQITVASGITAAVAGTLIAFASEPWQLALGAFLFFSSIVLDCSDGQLARLKGQSSFAGTYLDGMVDVVSTASIFVGHFAFMLRHDVGFWLAWCGGWAAGYAVKWHSHTYDHVKNVYLLNTEPPEKAARAYPSMEMFDRERDEHLRHGRRASAFMTDGYRKFVIQQRNAQQKSDPAVATSDAERALYRSIWKPYMRAWTFNGLGTHLFLLTVATLACAFDPRAPLVAWAIIIAPLTLLAFALMAWKPRLEARFRAEKARLSGTP
jgi:hypothetical protein